MSFVLLFCSLFLTPAFAAEPGTNSATNATTAITRASATSNSLYRKITKETSLSLKDAFQAVSGNDRAASARLLFFARKTSHREFDRFLETEIASREKYCETPEAKRQERVPFSADCLRPAQELKAARVFTQDLAKNFLKLPDTQKHYYAALLFGFTIREKVLEADSQSWESGCGSNSKREHQACIELQEALIEMNSLAGEITRIALIKAQNVKVPPQIINELKARIAQYGAP